MAINTRRRQLLGQRIENFCGSFLVKGARMPRYLPVTFGIMVAAFVATPALAAQSQLVNHNDSVMRMQIGNALDGVSTIKIYYENPSEKMNQLVQRGDLFFTGSIQWDTRKVIGDARVYKWGCEPLEYQVKGILTGQRNEIGTLQLEGWAPTFDHGCRLDEYVWNHNSRLTFEPVYASAPLPPRYIRGLRKGMELGWVYTGYVTCADYGCNSLLVHVPADGVNVRTFPDGPVSGSLVNGTPLVVLERDGKWFHVAAACDLRPTGVWSDTHGVPLSRCY